MKNPFALLFVLILIKANAQIVYTDINPDQTFNTNGSAYHLDLNNNGISDFDITYTAIISVITGTPCGSHTGTNLYIRVTPLGANDVGSEPGYEPDTLQINSLIEGSSLGWENFADQILSEKQWRCVVNYWGGKGWQDIDFGYWDGALNKYLALRLHVGSQMYYGWLRLDVAAGDLSFTVKDYACNSVPDSSILAGDKGSVATGISSPENQNRFSIYPNPSSDKITLSFSSPEKKEIQITSMLGQIVFSEKINSEPIEINVSTFPKGMYLIAVSTSSHKYFSKFLKE